MDLVEAVERVASHMQQEWGFLITDDAIEFFRKEYDHRYADRGLSQGILTDADAAACHLTLDATDSEINAALAIFGRPVGDYCPEYDPEDPDDGA